jgi:hypothetical protein
VHPEFADQLPPTPGAAGQGMASGERGRLSVPDDGRRDRASSRRAQALRWAKAPRRRRPRPHAPGRRRSSWPAARYRPRRMVRLRAGGAASLPARPFGGCPARARVSRAGMTRLRPLPTLTAETCLRRRKWPPTRHYLQTTLDNDRSVAPGLYASTHGVTVAQPRWVHMVSVRRHPKL